MKYLPQVRVRLHAKEFKMPSQTARSVSNHMTSIGVLIETSVKTRDKVYVYRKYLSLLEEGAEPWEPLSIDFREGG